jgi:hypothetical protein
MTKLFAFLRRLDEASLHYLLGSYRDSVTVHVTASPDERWEVDFFANGTVEVERFRSTGGVFGADEALLDSLFED